MENKQINLKINSNIDDVTKEVKSLNKNLEKTTEEVKEVGKSTKEVEKNSKTLADGFKGVGLAIKAMGIGLVISAMGTLKEVFMSNQKVADAMATAMGTVVNVFTKVVDVVVSVVEKVNQSSNGFKGLTNVISGLITISLTPLKLGFYSISLAIDEARLAWEQSFFGDKDPKTIKELNKRISSTKDNIVEVGKNAVDAGKKVANNIGDAITEVGAVVEGTIDGVSKISIKGAYEQAKANTQLQNTAKLAEANQARLVEQYDRQAEKLRQVRDEERNSITDRIKANDKLKDVLNNQEKAMLAQADAQIAAATATLQQNKSIENQVALTNALANREGVLAQIEGLRSEQKANDLSLNKELLDLTKSKQEAETQLAIDQKQFDAERLKDEEKQLLAKKEALEFSKKTELERLQNVIDTTKKGTQARVDAENEYAAKKQEIENQITTAQDEIDTYRSNKKIQAQQELIDNEKIGFENRLKALQEQNRLIQESTDLSEEEKRIKLKENKDKEVSIEQAAADAKLAIQNAQLDNVSKGISLLQSLGIKNKALQKGLVIAENAAGIAKTIINTMAANAKAIAASPLTGGQPFVTANTISGALGVATSIAATAKALSALGGGEGGGGGASLPSGGGGTAPTFNVVGQGGANQIAESISNRESQPVRAFVVGQDVTTQQGLNRGIVQNATLG